MRVRLSVDFKDGGNEEEEGGVGAIMERKNHIVSARGASADVPILYIRELSHVIKYNLV